MLPTLSTARVATLLAVVVALFASGVAAGAAGAALIIGQSNGAGSTSTTLNSSSSGPTLRLNNNGTGRGLEVEADGVAPLRLIAPTGVAPLSVNSTKKVANLNADRLDGLDSTDLLAADEIVITQVGTWYPQSASDRVLHGSGGATFEHNASAGSGNFWLPLTAPGELGAHAYALSAVEICSAASGQTTTALTTTVYEHRETFNQSVISDATDYSLTTQGCYTVTDAAPEAVDGAFTLHLLVEFETSGHGIVTSVRTHWVPAT